jgi:hypothetical protein
MRLTGLCMLNALDSCIMSFSVPPNTIILCQFSCCFQRIYPVQTPDILRCKSHVDFPLFRFSQECDVFCSEKLSASPLTPKQEDCLLSAVCCCLFKIFAAPLHIWKSYTPSETWECVIPNAIKMRAHIHVVLLAKSQTFLVHYAFFCSLVPNPVLSDISPSITVFCCSIFIPRYFEIYLISAAIAFLNVWR